MDILEKTEKLVALCCDRGITVGTAESCTGGLIAGLITEISGSSAMFNGGIVSYANSVKHDLLGVDTEILDTYGAVSAECAEAMVLGAKVQLKVDYAAAVTGIAGPGGGTPEKPVGTVYIAIATPDDVMIRVFQFEGDREAVRVQTCECAIEGLLVAISA